MPATPTTECRCVVMSPPFEEPTIEVLTISPLSAKLFAAQGDNSSIGIWNESRQHATNLSILLGKNVFTQMTDRGVFLSGIEVSVSVIANEMTFTPHRVTTTEPVYIFVEAFAPEEEPS